MASGQGGRVEAGASGSSGLAKPLYLQRLERSLRLDSFLRHTAAIFNRDITRYRQRGLGVVALRLRFSSEHMMYQFQWVLHFKDGTCLDVEKPKCNHIMSLCHECSIFTITLITK